MLRAESAGFGPVASDPTISRLIGALTASGGKALRALRSARAEARERVWRLAGRGGPDAGGTGEPVAALLRPGNAGSNTAADHITATQLALVRLPKKYRRGRRTLIRTDSGVGLDCGSRERRRDP